MAWALVLAVLPAASAQALVVHVSSRHFLGVALRRGAQASSIAGARPAARTSSTPGALVDNGGPVLHSSSPYLIFWTPGTESIPASTQALIERYFTDVAADSGTGASVYGVSRQYSDASGFADNLQSFSPTTQVITDTTSYPTQSPGYCPYVSATYSHCITDTQLQAEVQHELATVPGLPTDGPTGASSLPAGAPVYFVVLPTDVNLCFGSGAQVSCAGGGSNGFCAYHSAFTYNRRNVLYAAIPTLIVGPGQNPKLCQSDGTSAVQEPNSDPGDVVLKYLSHEDAETITDPLGTAWYDPSSGNETGDNCNLYGSNSPAAGTSQTAFAPVLGGSASGTLYDQLINHDQYYVQSEWSNGHGACDLQPATGTLTPAFSSRATAISGGVAMTFDPTASSSTGGYSSATWNFGDGSPKAFNRFGNTLLPVSHTYTSQGTYTVTLTLVDDLGDLSTLCQQVRVDEPPSAAFTVTADPGSGLPASFDASGSSDTDGSIARYAWDFGDGSTGTGAAPSHVYAAPGVYTVTATVTDSDGMIASYSQPLTVAGPSASVTGPSSGLIGGALGFDATGSNPGPGSTLSYSWSFGDGGTATGARASHAFSVPGSYPVTLTVVNDLGQSDSSVQQVSISDELPSAAFTVSGAGVGSTTSPTSFDASGSSDPDGSIATYSWSFGDGSSGAGPSPIHQYARAGTYAVTLSVTDSSGEASATVSSEVLVHASPVAAFAVTPAQAVAGAPARFDGTLSTDAEPGVGIVVYLWDFNDRTSGEGPTVVHTFTHPGSYQVTLTVINGAGLSSTFKSKVDVAQPARITHVAVRSSPTGALLLVTVSGAGRLRFGGHDTVVARAGVVRLRERLTAGQLHTLLARRGLRLRSALAFFPLYGPVCRDTLTIAFRPRQGASKRFNAVLLRSG